MDKRKVLKWETPLVCLEMFWLRAKLSHYPEHMPKTGTCRVETAVEAVPPHCSLWKSSIAAPPAYTQGDSPYICFPVCKESLLQCIWVGWLNCFSIDYNEVVLPHLPPHTTCPWCTWGVLSSVFVCIDITSWIFTMVYWFSPWHSSITSYADTSPSFPQKDPDRNVAKKK